MPGETTHWCMLLVRVKCKRAEFVYADLFKLSLTWQLPGTKSARVTEERKMFILSCSLNSRKQRITSSESAPELVEHSKCFLLQVSFTKLHTHSCSTLFNIYTQSHSNGCIRGNMRSSVSWSRILWLNYWRSQGLSHLPTDQ